MDLRTGSHHPRFGGYPQVDLPPPCSWSVTWSENVVDGITVTQYLTGTHVETDDSWVRLRHDTVTVLIVPRDRFIVAHRCDAEVEGPREA